MFWLPSTLLCFSLFLEPSLFVWNGKYFLILVFQLTIPCPGGTSCFLSHVNHQSTVSSPIMKCMAVLPCYLWLFLPYKIVSLTGKIACLGYSGLLAHVQRDGLVRKRQAIIPESWVWSLGTPKSLSQIAFPDLRVSAYSSRLFFSTATKHAKTNKKWFFLLLCSPFKYCRPFHFLDFLCQSRFIS